MERFPDGQPVCRTHASDSTDALAATDRQSEIAEILARGLLRLHANRARLANNAPISPESPPKGLDSRATCRPHPSPTVNGSEIPEILDVGGDG